MWLLEPFSQLRLDIGCCVHLATNLYPRLSEYIAEGVFFPVVDSHVPQHSELRSAWPSTERIVR